MGGENSGRAGETVVRTRLTIRRTRETVGQAVETVERPRMKNFFVLESAQTRGLWWVYPGDSKGTNERGPSLVGSLGLSCQYKTFYSALTALVGPVQNIFFLTMYTISIPLCQSASKLGR
jgi:hypothetical protein